MNRNEDESKVVDLPGLPLPPPFPDFLFSDVVHGAKLFSDVNDEENESLEIAVKRLTDAETNLYPEPYYAINTHLQSQLQEGPKCGLVALSIATSKTENFKSADELFAEAVEQGFTTQGEMYSAENLATLAERTTKFSAIVLDSGIYSHIDCIFHCLQNGGLMLIPYDADFNYSPCCKRGHNAHWAVISGIVIFILNDSEESGHDVIEGTSIVLNSETYPPCQCQKIDNKKFFTAVGDKVEISRKKGHIQEEKGINPKKGKIFLAGKQGKSKHLALWPFEVLAESNNNLIELSERQKCKQFALPNGGIASGLKGRVVSVPNDDEERSKYARNGSNVVKKAFKKAWKKMRGSNLDVSSTVGDLETSSYCEKENSELEDLETPPRYRPDSLKALCRATKFTEAEIKRIYRGFKAECPTGVVKEDTFKGIYSQFFPHGANASQYAHYVFNTLDRNRSGILSFEDFVTGLSILSRGTIEEKLKWTFSLYDINGDGSITREEMADIIAAIYGLMGKCIEPIDEITLKQRVDRIFQKMDMNQDGVVTLEEFLDCCTTDAGISTSMGVFDFAF